MQEEVTQKTIALSVNVGKGAARLTEQALQKAIKKFLEQKSNRQQRTSERMSQTAALLKTKRRELGNVMKKDGGSNLRMEPIRRERRVKTTAVKNHSGFGQEEDGGHLTPKVI